MHVNRTLGLTLATAGLLIGLMVPVVSAAADPERPRDLKSESRDADDRAEFDSDRNRDGRKGRDGRTDRAARYSPRQGPTFNNPLGGLAARNAIYRKIMKSIAATPRGGEIKIFTWNFLAPSGVDALVRAQKRGVRVRLLMDANNLNDPYNKPFRSLRYKFAKGNRGRKPKNRSWARVCQATCRAGRGAAHSKFFMFAQSGKAKRVVIQGSANFTVASTTNQWNDVYTHRGHQGIWDFYSKVFSEASKDRQADRVYLRKNFKRFDAIAFPSLGRGARDPVMQMLNKVRCNGAKNTGNGRTVLRISPDVLRTDRGMRLAKKLRSLWNNGCNMIIGYTIIGIDVGRYLRSPGPRGPVPLRHLVQDTNDDGFFDNYFHMKSMSIRGHYDGDRTGWAVMNGSANWTGVSRASDENVGIYYSPRLVKRYEEHLNHWIHSGAFNGRTMVFGGDENAVYESGRPVNGRRVAGSEPINPFANIEVD